MYLRAGADDSGACVDLAELVAVAGPHGLEGLGEAVGHAGADDVAHGEGGDLRGEDVEGEGRLRAVGPVEAVSAVGANHAGLLPARIGVP